MLCPYCSNENSDTAIYCGFCGQKIPREQPSKIFRPPFFDEEKKRKIKVWTLGTILVFIPFGAFILGFLLSVADAATAATPANTQAIQQISKQITNKIRLVAIPFFALYVRDCEKAAKGEMSMKEFLQCTLFWAGGGILAIILGAMFY